MENKKQFSVAEYSTGTVNNNALYIVNKDSTIQTVDANPQLKYWIEAKSCYMGKVKDNPKPEPDDLYFIINNLGDSLVNLFGQNYLGKNRKTPSLETFVNSYFPTKGFSLKDKDLIVYKIFNDFIHDYDLTKHPDKSKNDRLSNISKLTVQKYLEATRKIWILFGEYKYQDKMNDDSIYHFKDCFIELV